MTLLSEVADINPRLSAALVDDDTVSFLGMADVSESGKTSLGAERPYSSVKKGFTPFLNGDILVAKITPCFENGKIAQAVVAHSHAFGSTEFHVIRAQPDVADPRYLLHMLRSPRVRAGGERRMTGSAGQKRVPKAFLEALDIPLPPLPEQRRIAAIVDQADDLRTKRRKANDLLDELVSAKFIEMFGDPVSSSKFERRPIREIGNVVTGNTPSRSDPENFGKEIEWIKSDNLSTGASIATAASEFLSQTGRLKSRTVTAGSVLVTCIAGSPNSIGNAAIVDREVAFNQQINAIVPNQDVDSWFLLHHLKLAKSLVQGASTGGMKGLVSKSKFESIELLAPPKTIQAEFTEFVATIERLKARHARAEVHAHELFASLQHRAFSGQL